MSHARPLSDDAEAERLAVAALVEEARADPVRIPHAEMRERMARMIQQAEQRIAELARLERDAKAP